MFRHAHGCHVLHNATWLPREGEQTGSALHLLCHALSRFYALPSGIQSPSRSTRLAPNSSALPQASQRPTLPEQRGTLWPRWLTAMSSLPAATRTGRSP